jgi:RND superfamily putative drug exporter
MVSSLTVLPALLAKLGRRIDGGKLLRRKQAEPAGENRVWSAMLRPSMKHPVATATIGLAILVGLAAPALGMKLSVEGKETYPDSLETIATYDAMVEEFPEAGVFHMVTAEVDPSKADELAAAVADLESQTQSNPLFAETDQPQIRVSPDGSAVAIDLPIHYPTSDPRAAESLELLRDDLVPNTIGQIDGATYAVSGEPAYAADFSELQSSRLLVVLGFVLIATLIIMFVTFKSWIVAVLSTVLNLLSSLTAWGAIVLVFQGTWAEGLLDFESPGFLGSRTPLMIFAILFGLSLDYQLFVMSRIKEAAKRGLTPAESIREGILSSASVVTSAAVIMVSVFAAFVFTDRFEMKQLGFALALGVLLDAVVVRVMLLPALMTVIERRGWWPRRWAAADPAESTAAEPLAATQR